MFEENLRVEKIPSNIGKEFIKQHHYSHGVHNGPMCYGLLQNERLVGVCAFATPCSENVRASIFGADNKHRVTELHRLVLLDEMPRNTESWFISRALKELKKNKPELWGILSFADATEGHLGIIYQATNALYLGTSSPATFYIDQTGRLRHPRQNGVNITRQMAEQNGWSPVKREGKHRYLYILPDSKTHKKQLLKSIKSPQFPYPKVKG